MNLTEKDTLKIHSDSSLIELVVENMDDGPEAYDILVRRYHPLIRSIVAKILSDDTMAIEDVCQETYLKALSRIGHLRNRDHFKSWLCAIARNHAIDTAKKRSMHISLDGVNDDGESFSIDFPDFAANPLESQESSEIRELMSDVISEIPELYREPILLRYSEDFDYVEIAKILGKPLGTVKSLIFRAKQLIREELTRRSWGEEGLHVLAS